MSQMWLIGCNSSLSLSLSLKVGRHRKPLRSTPRSRMVLLLHDDEVRHMCSWSPAFHMRTSEHSAVICLSTRSSPVWRAGGGEDGG